MPRSPTAIKRGPGRPRTQDYWEFAHFEALRQLTGKPLYRIMTDSTVSDIAVVSKSGVEKLVIERRRAVSQLHGRYYRMRQRCRDEPDTFGREMQRLVEHFKELLSAPPRGAFFEQ